MNGHSIYLIGSEARGNTNHLSDVDYVCIYDKIKPAFEGFTQPNCNVSYYNSARLQWMASNSKLFIKHILLDGVPIVEEKRHRKILRSFSLKKDIVLKDLTETEKNIKQFSWIPDTENGLFWACDYLYFLSRNFVFLANALEGVYDFDFQTATLRFLSKSKNEQTITSFLKVRNGKYRYRGGKISVVSIATMPDLNIVIATLIGRETSLNIGGETNFRSLDKLSYPDLRLLERAILNGEIQDNGFCQKLRSHGEYFFELRRLSAHIIQSAKHSKGADSKHPSKSKAPTFSEE